MVLVMLSIALNIFIFDTVTMNYLVTGHSQNENDCAHSCIEKHTKDITIFTPDQWETAIQISFLKKQVEVHRSGFEDTIDLKDSTSLHSYRNTLTSETKKNDDGSKIYWSKIMQIKFIQSGPLDMLFKYSYLDSKYRSAKLAHFAKSTRMNSASKFHDEPALPKLYSSALTISNEKKQDLLKLCGKQLIPAHHHHFYKNLTL